MKIKLFVYHKTYKNPLDIHAMEYCNNNNLSLCNKLFLNDWDGYSIVNLDTSKPFCQKCTQTLKDDYDIDIKQLAINQKLGVK